MTKLFTSITIMAITAFTISSCGDKKKDEDGAKTTQKETADFKYIAKDVRDGSGNCVLNTIVSEATFEDVSKYNHDAEGYISAYSNDPMNIKVAFEGTILEETVERNESEPDTTYLEIDENNVALIIILRDSATFSGKKGSVERLTINHKYISGSYKDFMDGKEITIKPLEASVEKVVRWLETTLAREALDAYPAQALASDPYCKIIKLESGPIYLSKEEIRFTNTNMEVTMQITLKEENCNLMRESL